MVLGNLLVTGHPTIRMIVEQGRIALAVGAGGKLFGYFLLSSTFSLILPSLSGRRPDID